MQRTPIHTFLVAALVAALLPFSLFPVPVAQAVSTTVVVTAQDLELSTDRVVAAGNDNWFFYNDENDTINNTLGSFVAGPATPPEGIGSAQISVSGTQRRNLATYRFRGTPLADITTLAFSTYNPSAGNGGPANRSAYLNFNVDFDGSDTWQRRLVYVPRVNGTVIQDTWQEWDAIDEGNALWSWSGGSPWPDGFVGTNRTWNSIKAAFPNARIRVSDSWLGLRVGEPYGNGYTEYIDAFKFGVGDDVVIFDFEPTGDGPLTSNVVAAPNPAKNGELVTLMANVDDFTTDGSTIQSAEYTLDNGANWTPLGAQDSNFNEVSEDVSTALTAPEVSGVYNLCVRGKDATNIVGPKTCILFVVYDPTAGFVTGGGWISSPPGAYKLHDYDAPQLVWDQGFESGASGWFDTDDAWSGMVTRVSSGHNGMNSASGGYHAVFEGDDDSAPFSRFDSYRDTWSGTWIAEIDIFLDPVALDPGEGFDYSVATNGSDGNHQRDFIFHVTKDSSTGDLLVAGSNNSNFAPREDLETINHYVVTTAGWYTFQHVFRDQGGILEVDLNLLSASGTILFTETRSDPSDTIPAEVGGNRYAWFTVIDVAEGIAVDNHQLVVTTSPPGKANFGFVSKYKKGATVPDGATTFVFQAAGLNFHSNVQEWLVVNQGGTNAQFKGSGTINGALAPNNEMYKFMIWAGDGSPDTFRIKIWYEDGGEIVVYDNGTDQPIGGGSIVIHTDKSGGNANASKEDVQEDTFIFLPTIGVGQGSDDLPQLPLSRP